MGKDTIEIRKIDAWSMGKIFAALGVIWGIIIGIFTAIGVLIGSSTAGAMGTYTFPGWAAFAGLGSIAAFIIMIIIGAIGGLITGIITAVIYNIAAGWTGGIKVKIK
jgi:hypothetical protein